MKAFYLSLRRGNKWYRKLAKGLLFGSGMVNVDITYKKIKENKISVTEFKNRWF